VPLFTSGGLGLGLVTLVLVLRIWSRLHHWYFTGQMLFLLLNQQRQSTDGRCLQ